MKSEIGINFESILKDKLTPFEFNLFQYHIQRAQNTIDKNMYGETQQILLETAELAKINGYYNAADKIRSCAFSF